jgi:hypothetical protein
MSRIWYVWIITKGSYINIHSTTSPIGSSIIGKEDLELVITYNKVLI